MHYELWGTRTGNRIATPDTEIQALALVRGLIEVGWDANDLALGLEADNEFERASLPPVLEGSALMAKAYEYA